MLDMVDLDAVFETVDAMYFGDIDRFLDYQDDEYTDDDDLDEEDYRPLDFSV